MKRISFFFFLCLSVLFTSNAQQHHVEVYGINEGLPQSQVLSMIQDRKGFLWMGTGGGGVCRFDGINFKVFSHKNGLPNDSVHAILQDKKGNFWFGTEGGLSKYAPSAMLRTNGKSFTNYTEKDGLAANHIWSLLEDNKGNLWIATDNGISKLEFIKSDNNIEIPVFTNFTSEDGLSHNRTYCISKDKDGGLWFGTESGLCLLNLPSESKSKRSDKKNFICYTAKNGFTDKAIKDIHHDKNRNIWLATDDGVFKRYLLNFYHYTTKDGLSSNMIQCIYEEKNGNMWFGTIDNGINIFNGEKFTAINTKIGLSSNTIRKILKDTEGNMWFGTDGGVFKYNPKKEKRNVIKSQTIISGIRLFYNDTMLPENAALAYNMNHITFNFVGLCYTNPSKVLYQYRLKGYENKWSPVTDLTSAGYTNLPPGEYTFKVKSCNNEGRWNNRPAEFSFIISTPFWQTLWFRWLVIAAALSAIWILVKWRTAQLRRVKEKIEISYKTVQLLSKIGKDIASALSPEKIVETTYENVNRLMDAAVFSVGIYNAEHKTLDFPGDIEKGEKLPFNSEYLHDINRPAVWCFNHRKELFANDWEEEYVKYFKKRSSPVVGVASESLIYMPLIHKENCLGVLTVQSIQKNAYTEYHLNILRSMSVYVAIALENARLYGNMEEEVKIRTAEIADKNKELEQLSIVAKETDNAVLIFDKDFRLEWVNASFTRLTGYTLEEYIAEKGENLHNLSNQDEIADIIKECLRTKKSVHYNIENISKSGNKIHIQTTLTPILDEDGNIKKLVAIDVDITNIKQAEEKLDLQNQELNKSYDNITLLSQIGQKITSTLDLEKILNTVYDNVNAMMDATEFGIGVLNEEKQAVDLSFYIYEGKKLSGLDSWVYLKDKNRLSVWCIDNKKEVFINDIGKEHKKYIPDLAAYQGEGKLLLHSVICLPLIIEDKVVGLISIQSPQKNAYTPLQLEMFRTLASYTAVALNNAESFKKLNVANLQLEQSYQNITILSDIGKQITSTLDLEKILDTVYECVNQLMDATIFGIGRYLPDENIIEYKLTLYKGTKYKPYKREMTDKNQFPVWCIENKQPVFINNVHLEYQKYMPGYKDIIEQKTLEGGTKQEEPLSMIYLPIILQGKVYGIITAQSLKENAYTERHLQILQTLASYIAIAIANADAYHQINKGSEQLKQSYENITLLGEIGQQITSTLDIDKILDTVYQNVNVLMDATEFGIGIIDEIKQVIDLRLSIYESKTIIYTGDTAYASLNDKKRLSVWCVDNQKEVFINDMDNEYKNFIPSLDSYKDKTHQTGVFLLQSLICLPLFIEQRVIGVIYVQSPKKNAYSNLQFEMLRTLASYAAVALNNADAYKNLNAANADLAQSTEQLQQSYKNITLLSEIGQKITSTLDLEKILDIVYENVNALMDATEFGIGIYNEEKQEIRINLYIYQGKRLFDMDASIPMSGKNRLSVSCVEKKQEIFINDIENEHKKYIDNLDAYNKGGGETLLLQSVICIPLLIENRVLGLITVQSPKKNVYTRLQLEMFRTLASYTAVALNNAESFKNLNAANEQLATSSQQLKQSYQNITLLSQIGQQITSTLDLETVLDIVYENVNALMDATEFGVQVLDKKKQELNIKYQYYEGQRMYESDFWFPLTNKNRFSVWSIINKKEVFVNDMESEFSKYLENLDAYKDKKKEAFVLQSLIYIPLIIEEDVMGGIFVQSPRKNAYTSLHLEMFRNLASYTAVALNNAEAYKHLNAAKAEVEQSYKNITLLNEIGQQVTSTLSVEEIIERVHQSINQLMDATSFGIGVFNEEQNMLDFPGFIEKNQKLSIASIPLTQTNRPAVWCFKNLKEFIANDYEEDYKRYFHGLPMQIIMIGDKPESVIYLPLFVKQKPFGVITVQSFRKNAYESHHVNILKTLAAYVGIALENARLYKGVEESYENITLLSTIGQQITSTLDLETVLNIVYENVNKLMDASAFLIGYYNEKEQKIEMRLGMEKGERLPYVYYDMKDKNRLAVWCVDNKKEVFINDNAENAKYVPYIPPIIIGELTQSVIYVPLIVENKVIGVITVQSFQKNAYTQYHLEILKTFASYASVALNNAESFKNLNIANEQLATSGQQLKQSYENITLLSQIGQQITSTLDLETVLNIVYENVNKLMDASAFLIGYYNEKEQKIEMRLGIEKGKRLEYWYFDMTDKNRLAVWCVDNKKEVFINDINNEHTAYIKYIPPVVAGEDTQSVIYLPLVVEDKVVGTMSAQSFQKNAYTQYHLEILKTFASYASVALNNAESFKNLNIANEQLAQSSQQLKQSYENITLLSQIGQQITSTLDLETVLKVVYENVNKLMDASSFLIGYYHNEKQIIEMKMGIENGEMLPYHEWTMNDKNRLAVWCVDNKKEILIKDYQKEFNQYIPNIKIPEPAAGELPESVIYLPLIVEDKIVGIMSVQSFQKNAYTNYHLELVRTLASYVAVALNNSEAYKQLNTSNLQLAEKTQQVEQSYQNITLLSQIGQQITSTLDLETVLNVVYENVNKLMDASGFYIGYYNETEQKIEFKLGMEKGERLPNVYYDMADKNRLAVWCVENGKEMLTNNWTEDYSTYFPNVSRAKPVVGNFVESIIYIPLIVEDKVVGTISVQSFQKNAYTQYHLEILRTFASYASVALNNAESFKNLNIANEQLAQSSQQLKQSYENITLLSQIGQQITSTLDLETVLNIVYENVNKLMDATEFGIHKLNPERTSFNTRYVIYEGEKMYKQDLWVSVQDPSRLSAWSIRNNKKIFIQDMDTEHSKYISSLDAYVAASDKFEAKDVAFVLKSLMYVPLSIEDKVIGGIFVQSKEKNAYSPLHFEMLKTLSSYTAQALNNADAYQQLNKSSEQLKQSYENITLLSKIGQQITSTLDLETVLNVVYENVNKLMDASSFLIGYYNEEKQIVEMKLGVEKGNQLPYCYYDMADKNRLAVWCVDNKKEIFINDFYTEHTKYIQQVLTVIYGEDTESIIYIPLIVENKVVGVISVQSFQKNAYTNYHLEILRTFASYASVALNNAESFKNLNIANEQLATSGQQLKQSYENITLLSQIGQQITSTLDLETVLNIVHENVNKLMDATSFLIGSYNEEKQIIEMKLGIELGEKQPYFEYDMKDKNRFAVWCVDNQKEIFINDNEQEYRKYIPNRPKPKYGTTVNSLIYLPLIVENKVVGVITVQSFKKNAYTQYHLEILRTFASYASVALNNAESFKNLNIANEQLAQSSQQLKQSYENITLLSQIGQQITSTLDLEKILNTVYDNVNTLMDATEFWIGLYNKEKQVITGNLYIYKGERIFNMDDATPMNDPNRLSVWCIVNKKEVFINDIENEYGKYIANLDSYNKGGGDTFLLQSVICIPLLIENAVMGVISVQSPKKNVYTRLHLEMFRNLASYTAVALNNAEAYKNLNVANEQLATSSQQLKQSYENITLLSEIGQQITSTLDLETVLNIVHENVNKLMDASAFLIGYYNEEQQIIDMKLGIEKGKKLDYFYYDMKDKNRFAVWCVDNKKEIFLNDIYADYKNYVEYIPPMISGEDTQSLIYLPLIVENKVVGVITVQSFEKNAYTQYHLEILKTFASYASVALNNAESFKNLNAANEQLAQSSEQLKQSYENITLLSQIGQQITSTLDLETVLNIVYENVNKLMDASAFIIGYYNEKEQKIEWRLGMEKGERLPYVYYDMKDKTRLAVWCVDNKKEIFIKDCQKDFNQYIPNIKIPKPVAGEDAQSIMYLPLIVEDKVVGIITVQSFEKNAYTQYHLEILRTFASYASVALNNAEAFKNLNVANEQLAQSSQQLKQSYKNITLLSQIGQQITSTLDLEKVLNIVYENVNQLMDASSFNIGYYNEEKQMIEMRLGMEKGKQLPYTDYDMTDKNRLAVWCVDNKKEIFINDYDNEHTKYIERDLPVITGEDTDSMIFLPLIVEDNVVGIITVQSFQKNAYTKYHLEILRTFASYASVALNNAEAYKNLNIANERSASKTKQLQQSYQNITLLSEIGQQITSTLDLEKVLNIVYENVNKLMDASSFYIGYYNEKEQKIEAKLAMEKGERLPYADYDMKDKNRLAVWCVDNKKEIFIKDLQKDFNRYIPNIKIPKPVTGEPTESLIYLPLIVENKIVGIMSVQSFKKNAYTNYHVELAKTLASYAAVALNNAEAYNILDIAHQELKQTQTQLVQAEKMAGLGQLTAGIAHEINNPINFVSANVKSLRRDVHDIINLVGKYDGLNAENGGTAAKIEDATNYKKEIDYDYTVEEVNNLLNGIEEGAKRTSEIVKGLRNFSRLDEADIKKADIHECIDGTLMLLHNKYKDKAVINKEYSEIPHIECYPGQINQVLMNILSNAIDAISEKGDISIKTYTENQQAYVSIKDNGAGMDEQTKARIFEPFFTTKKVGEGTGLGLSISFGIIKKHNGEIKVNSSPGNGTEFIIILPINQTVGVGAKE